MNEFNAGSSRSLMGVLVRAERQNPDYPIGTDTQYRDEKVHIHVEPGLSMPVAESQTKLSGGHTEVTTSTYGLWGVVGAMPYVYSEIIERSVRAKEFAVRDFLNIFNQRAVSLLFRGWKKSRICQEPKQRDEEGTARHAALLESLAGLRTLPDSMCRLPVDHDGLLSCTDLFARRVRSALAFEQLLKRQFDLDFRLTEFVGQWLYLPRAIRSRLGSVPTGFQQAQLGCNAIIGSISWQAQSHFSVDVLHPTKAQYWQLKPASTQLQMIQMTVRLFVGPDLDFFLVVFVRAASIPRMPLSTNPGNAMVLGWNSVIGSPPDEREYRVKITRNYNTWRST